ncbi:MAG: UDP-N-acetylmuramoyl-L-alanyl-D-glutamate--2,6-diaminopimelate ligase, partial [Alistipes sp.]|nr:UDP-N-acetylmuramoyl-L-alanyl-D-glutamate--2,6-diaminopimelate ligase [Alistipes sp.]
MKHLSEILSSTEVRSFTASSDPLITGLTFDSREVKAGDCFFALRGTQVDGHDYIERATEAGAAAVVCEQLPERLSDDVCYVVVENSSSAMADIAAAYYDHPSRELSLVGVTGTNGKTTIATLLYDLYRAMGYRVGLISTVVYRIDRREIPSTHTTPDALRLQAMLREMVDCGCEYCFMEVSSHSLVQDRVRGLEFCGAAFTNLTHDHLDYHGTFKEYIRAKKLLFDRLPKRAFAVVNADDRNGEVVVQNCRARVATYSLRQMATYHCKVLEMLFDGMLLRLNDRELWVGMIGRFNAYNLACVYGIAMELGAR